MVDLTDLKAKNTARWPKTMVDASRVTEFSQIADNLIAAKSRYQAVSLTTKVPWPIIAVIHEREASQSWRANLAQGDPWDAVSTHVPRGEGPFRSWEDAAQHALISDDHLDTWEDWSIGSALTALEKFNGMGYYLYHHTPSPYVWAGSNQYVSGKYVGDGQYDGEYVDRQPGCASLLICMMKKDPTIAGQLQWELPDGGGDQPIPQPLPDVVTNEWIQDALNRLGADPQLTVDGEIGPKSKAAIRAFQSTHGLLDDGKAGPLTIAAIRKALNEPRPPVPNKDALAKKIIDKMRELNYHVSSNQYEYTIAYVEGWYPDGTKNANIPNEYNDARYLIQANPDGSAILLGAWDATTEPSKYWTEHPMNENGAARVCYGQHKAWSPGEYHGTDALRQAADLPVQRDPRRIYQRYGPIYRGQFGIHHHDGGDTPRNNIGLRGAGCLVARSVDGHRQFMSILRTDARFKANRGYLFEAAIIPSAAFDPPLKKGA